MEGRGGGRGFRGRGASGYELGGHGGGRGDSWGCDQSSVREVRVATWNVNDWTEGNGDSRCNIISLMNIDVVMISETHLKDNDLISIPDFTWLGFNRRGIHKKA